MSALDPTAAIESEEIGSVLPLSKWEKLEDWLARASDRLNPILVKEARQALRSRQFTTTFLLMLAAGWTWSILGLALLGPRAYYSAEGASMFFVYYLILSAPLLVILPYTAYHSLSTERQDRTFELLAITALNARQILTGKLCGIGLQMMVYLSALFPCLAFTYLLRGLDIVTVMLLVTYTCLLSLGMSVIALLLATLAPSRQRQIIQGILFLPFLCYVFIMNLVLMGSLIATAGAFYDDAEFWQVNLALATLYANLFALVFLAARAQLTTVSQNCSTALRVSLVVAQLSMLAWVAWATLTWGGNLVYGYVLASTLLWFLSGAFTGGEAQVLSPRVKRDLPQSLAGRTFLSWFAPGPGTGYMLAICNMLAVTLFVAWVETGAFRSLANLPLPRSMTNVPVPGVPGSYIPTPVPNSPRALTPGAIEMAIVATSYLVIYLGLGKLILSFLRRFDEVRLMLRVLVHLLLILVGVGVPWVLQLSNPQTRTLGYTLLQITNPIWTLSEYANRGAPAAGATLVWALPLAAVCVFALNLPSLVTELMQVRIAKPSRVAEEDATLVPEPIPQRSSPWDDEPASA